LYICFNLCITNRIKTPRKFACEKGNPETQKGSGEKEDQSKGPEKKSGAEGGGQAQQEEPEKSGPGTVAEDKEKGKDEKGGLTAYQAPQSQADQGEMSEQEAKMLLDGYRGEEATGKTIRMRCKPVNEPEPERDW